ncbi:amidohydrolase family protein [Haloglomus litoreum]|uniref:amidohydrolase family protein n=1 Tax=Haloglomus litoreum TaxID=3034026 RepID=UPI0023E8313F|nr:amidohydrolase family protein [Haloglomus sp. DT116]
MTERSGPGPGAPFAPAVDAHVHLMPERLMGAIRGALNEEAGWEFPHGADTDTIEAELRRHGVARYVALPYAHRAGIAGDLNDWLVAAAADSSMCIPFGTVHPEDDVRAVVRDAFEAGIRGLKFQCPVQEVAPDDERLAPAYELCAEYDRPVLFHAGTAPMFEDSPHVGIDRYEPFVASYPDVRSCAAHMGTFEHEAFVDLARDHDRVFLDTCFAMATVVDDYVDFDPATIPDAVFEDLAGQVMYGSDFPNMPHAYAREYEGLLARDLSAEAFDALFRGAAARFLEPEVDLPAPDARPGATASEE